MTDELKRLNKLAGGSEQTKWPRIRAESEVKTGLRTTSR